MSAVIPRAAMLNRDLAHLAEAGTLPIGNKPGEIGIGTAMHFADHRWGRKAAGSITITQAGRQRLWQEEAA